MPNWRELRVGDRVRLLCVPARDLDQREREIREGIEMPGWTADTIERILAQQPVTRIEYIDDYGHPWFEVALRGEDGTTEIHSLNITDDHSWERVAD